jgi:pimeloyl-ACP methyl ester carboxylesterase
MPTATANGIKIAYETHGSSPGAPLVLINGWLGSLVSWDQGFINELVGAGFRLITFDQRDVGFSSRVTRGGTSPWLRLLPWRVWRRPLYTLHDMADDVAGLLDALGIDAAHVVGISLGGHVAQVFATDHPTRTLSLCSIMSSTGAPDLEPPSPEAMAALFRGKPPSTPEEAGERAVEGTKIVGSKGLSPDWELVRRQGREQFKRRHDPRGALRQLQALAATGDRTAELARITASTVVVHGSDDWLVPPSHGRATAAAVPGAEFVLIDGMGHDIPPGAWAPLVDAISRNAFRAGSRAS